MPKLKIANPTFWVIFKQYATVIATFCLQHISIFLAVSNVQKQTKKLSSSSLNLEEKMGKTFAAQEQEPLLLCTKNKAHKQQTFS